MAVVRMKCRRAATVLVLGAAAVSGCGSDENRGAMDSRPTAKKAAERALKQTDEAFIRNGTAGRAVLDHWRRLKSGAVPVAVLGYDSKVRKRVGTAALAGALAFQQVDLANVEAVVTGIETTPKGQLVTVEVFRPDAPPVQQTYLLRRVNGDWLIVFDTLTQSAIQTHVQARVQGSIRPGATNPDPQAVEAGNAAAERFRTATFPESELQP